MINAYTYTPHAAPLSTASDLHQIIEAGHQVRLNYLSSKVFFLFRDVAEGKFIFQILLGGNQRGLGEFLVVLRNLNLLTVLVDFLKVVVQGSKLLKLLLKVSLHLGSNLVGALADDANGLVDVTRGLGHLNDVMHCSGEWRIRLLVIHITCYIL